jgi:hypothetical protein
LIAAAALARKRQKSKANSAVIEGDVELNVIVQTGKGSSNVCAHSNGQATSM